MELRGKTFIWFDLGYTLIRLERERNYRRLLDALGVEVSLEDLIKAFHRTDKTFMRHYPGVLGRDPKTYMPWYLGLLNYTLGLSLDLLPVMNLWMRPEYNPRGTWVCYDETHDVLKTLKTWGYRLGIISNWDHTARDTIERLGLTAYMDCIVISSEHGYEKPDERIFNIAFDTADVRPEECLYVGDNYYDDVIGSRRAGMDCLLISRFGRDSIEEVSDAEVIGSLKELSDRMSHGR